MSKRTEPDARRALELLLQPDATPATLAPKLGASPEAIDEARALAHEIDTAEIDAVLAMPPVLGRALLRAAVQAGRLAIVKAAGTEGDKHLQREAKRLAHALKLQGVELELPSKAAAPPRPAPEPAPAAEPPAFLSSLDGHGERAVFWTRLLPGRGVELAQVIVSDERGILDFLVAELSRKRFRELADEFPRRGEVTIREVSREEAARAIDRARVAARDGGECPGTFPAWAAQVLGPVPPEAPPPLAPNAPPPSDPAEVRTLVAASTEILEEPELRRWRPDDHTLRKLALRLDEVGMSALFLGGAAGEAQRSEAAAAAIDAEVESWFDERRRALYAGWLLDTGRLFEATDRPEQARKAAATARMLAGGAPATEIPFCRELFARIFRPRGSDRTEPRGEGASSLLVLPGAEEP
ncbi:MAG TPA: hypothetical protein VN033_00825 [Vulgatibacter sp.]|nr:hypothetical protein [Vulgatibacter sp.]